MNEAPETQEQYNNLQGKGRGHFVSLFLVYENLSVTV